MVEIRRFTAADRGSLFAVIAANVAEIYDDPRLMGEIYAAPYAVFEPEKVLVVEDDEGVGGYALGVWDTRAFEARLERDWWPTLRRRYPEPGGVASAFTPDQRRHLQVHRPKLAPDGIALSHPAHIHLHVMPRLQGRGIGAALRDAWLSEAARGGCGRVHAGVNVANRRAIGFWARGGFQPLVTVGSTVWLGCERAPASPT